MQAVCVILDVKPAKAKDEAGKPINDYWKPSVALLNEKDFLNKLKSYDKDNINPKLIEKIRSTYLTNEGFTPENAKKASPAAEGMCKWVHAMSSYEKVSPLQACLTLQQQLECPVMPIRVHWFSVALTFHFDSQTGLGRSG